MPKASAETKKRNQEVTVGNRRLKLTNLDKVLYPKTKTTKAEVIDYYARVADAILPHLKGRPLTLRRFPEGVGKPQTSFFEKNCPKHRPEWVKTTPIYVDRRAGEIDFCLCENLATLTWMAQLAALELHPSLSKATRMEQPTVLAFDLDPGAPAQRLGEDRGAALQLGPDDHAARHRGSGAVVLEQEGLGDLRRIAIAVRRLGVLAREVEALSLGEHAVTHLEDLRVRVAALHRHGDQVRAAERATRDLLALHHPAHGVQPIAEESCPLEVLGLRGLLHLRRQVVGDLLV